MDSSALKGVLLFYRGEKCKFFTTFFNLNLKDYHG
jgi:hypothetical protein